jgi:hypothetical protein
MNRRPAPIENPLPNLLVFQVRAKPTDRAPPRPAEAEIELIVPPISPAR